MLTVRGGLRHGDLPDLRTVLFAGEVFPTGFLRSLMEYLPHASFFNLYGPTETNVCTYFQVGPIPETQIEPVPIGEAIDGVEVFGVTDRGTIARPGEVGELYVRGPTVMQGYWGDEDRTKRSLVPDPRGTGFDAPVYRTGDLVRQGPDGNYRLLGRRDHQIKSRGYRIELGDIESALFGHPAVVECAVVALPDPLVTNRIVAFAATKEPVSQRELARFCGERLPRYMVPEQIELMASLPKTSTGKVDRQALRSGKVMDRTSVGSVR
jgi:acyl-coenzyme A synthetase/AMP-(fatty) acid ligase